MADTLRTPGQGAGIVRVHGTRKALAFTSDVTPRYVQANPVRGGMQAVAEAFRNLCAVGARPLATTDNLNFGNPQKPRIMGQLVGALEGIGAACAALDMPIVSGNVSLYNETDGVAILPTPTIGAVGLIDDLDDIIGGPARDGDVLLLLGDTHGHLGQSALLAEHFGREDGDAPPVDLDAERAHGTFVRTHGARIRACTDLGDGGIALAAFEMAEAAACGLSVDIAPSALLFAEDQARYLLACAPEDAEPLLRAAGDQGLPLARIGTFGGTSLGFGTASAPMSDLVPLYRGAFAACLS